MSDWRTSAVRNIAFTCQDAGCFQITALALTPELPFSTQIDQHLDHLGWERTGTGARCPAHVSATV